MRSKVPGSLRLFTAFGIDVFVHWSWLAVALIWYTFVAREGSGFSHPWWHALLYVSLFGIVTLHEFGHALACKSVGGRSDTIMLWPLGGVAFVQPPQRPGATLWSIAAGPLVNVALVPVLLIALQFVDVSITDTGGLAGTDLGRYVGLLNFINLLLLALNMLPVYPLDGGQILQSILWFFIGQVRSLKVAATIGLVVAGVGMAWAILIYHVWYIVLAGFIGWQAWNGLQYAKRLERFNAFYGREG